MKPQKSDVLIIGGGIMGSTSAFFLSRRGHSVTLLERDQIGQYASGVNFGNVRRQGRYLGQLELANRSWALWKRLPELIDDDLEFIASGHMRVCYREDEIAELEAYAAAPEAAQLDLKIYRGAELHQRFPFLGPDVKPEHVAEALRTAVGGPVTEGNVGGGSGMICHEFKGGIGTASRRLSQAQGGWTVGAIVQANHGIRHELRVDGYPVGRYMEQVDSPFLKASLTHPGMGSIVVCLATDAPLLPHQCTRLAQRASLGLARTGGGNEDHSGDIFIAFATGNDVPPAAYESKKASTCDNLRMVNNDHISELFLAATEAVEEAIINALLAGETANGN